MSKFITLTGHNGRPIRISSASIDAFERLDGKTAVYIGGETYHVTDAPDQIDALLAATASAEEIAATLEAEAARMDDDATAIHNGTMRGDMKLRAKAFRDAAKIARAAAET